MKIDWHSHHRAKFCDYDNNQTAGLHFKSWVKGGEAYDKLEDLFIGREATTKI